MVWEIVMDDEWVIMYGVREVEGEGREKSLCNSSVRSSRCELRL